MASGRLKTGPRARGGMVCLALAIVLAAASVAGQQKRWFELYDEAKEHVERNEWREAEQKLLAAQMSGPKPGRNVLRYGTWRASFFPDYYLGVVYLNTGRPREAIAKFEAARTQNLNERDNEFRQLDTQLASAKNQATALVAAARAPEANTSAQRPSSQPVVPAQPPAPIPRPSNPSVATNPPVASNPSVPGPAQQTAELLARARSQLDRRDYAEALKAVQDARRISGGSRAIDELEQQVRRSSAAEVVETALKERNLERATKALGDLERIDNAWSTTVDLRGRVVALRSDSERADAERQAMLAFFKGEYERTLTLLSSSARQSGPSARGYFYQACSLAALALRSNPKDAAKLKEARRMYALAGSDVADLARDRRYISPEIIKAISGS